jgi:hypothetical protein
MGSNGIDGERCDFLGNVRRIAVCDDRAGVGRVVVSRRTVEEVVGDVEGSVGIEITVNGNGGVSPSLVLDGGVQADEKDAFDRSAGGLDPVAEFCTEVGRTHPERSGIGVIEAEKGHGRR